MEDENYTGKNASGLLEGLRHTRDKNKHFKVIDRRGMNKSTMDRKYLERYID